MAVLIHINYNWLNPFESNPPAIYLLDIVSTDWTQLITHRK